MTSEVFRHPSRREVLAGAAGAIAATTLFNPARAQTAVTTPLPGDRVFLTNEDSNTLSVIDPVKDEVVATINLTSFDEDGRPPFRFVTGGVVPTHGDMIQKPLYHGAISVHGCVPSPDLRRQAAVPAIFI
jgi:YVTN family beta-propeller protein